MTYSTENSHTQTVSGNRDFTATFPFLSTEDIKVQLNGTTKTLSNDYTIVQSGASTVINFNTAPAVNDTIRIFRDTNIDAIEATYVPGNALSSIDLNNNNTQLLYAAQEFGTLKTDNSVAFSLGNKGDIDVNSSSDWVIKADAIENSMLANNAVGTSELLDNSVTQDKIADDAIQTAFIQDDQITNALMADDSINTAQIINSSITKEKINIPDLQLKGLNPVGTVIWYAGSSAPSGYLKCNGDAIANGSGTTQSITADFSALYAVVGANLPDLRGEFVRGWDDGKGTDSGRSIRTTQTGTNQQHTHSATTATTSLTGSITKISETYATSGAATGVFSKTSDITASNTPGGPDSSPCGGFEIDASHVHTTTIANEGGESRPRNVALLACIKY